MQSGDAITISLQSCTRRTSSSALCVAIVSVLAAWTSHVIHHVTLAETKHFDDRNETKGLRDEIARLHKRLTHADDELVHRKEEATGQRQMAREVAALKLEFEQEAWQSY